MKLRIKVLGRQEQTVTAEPTDNILSVKEQISAIEDIPTDQIRLIFKGFFLKDNETIESYRIKSGTRIQTVVALRSAECLIDINPSDKVINIKEKLEENEGIPPEQQRLIFQGKQMKDDKTVSSYKLKGGTVLHLVLALRGGAYTRNINITNNASSCTQVYIINMKENYKKIKKFRQNSVCLQANEK